MRLIESATEATTHNMSKTNNDAHFRTFGIRPYVDGCCPHIQLNEQTLYVSQSLPSSDTYIRLPPQYRSWKKSDTIGDGPIKMAEMHKTEYPPFFSYRNKAAIDDGWPYALKTSFWRLTNSCKVWYSIKLSCKTFPAFVVYWSCYTRNISIKTKNRTLTFSSSAHTNVLATFRRDDN